MFRRLVAAILVCGVPFFLGSANTRQNDNSALNRIDSIVKSLSEITGWEARRPVQSGRMSKRQLRSFLTKRIKKTLRPEEIYADELSLKLFGLVPQDFNLRQSTIDLLTEQAAAFYDYDQKKLFLLEGSSLDDETTTLAHELSHALADQHFDLEKYMDQAPANDDENLARSAVVEGQASWLMIAYELQRAGQPPIPTAEMLNSLVDANGSSASDFPVLKQAPLYIRQSLLFPYAQGTLFFDAVYKKAGKESFRKVFTDPPVDSAQILHPELYFNRVKPSEPGLPQLSSDKQTKEIAEGSVGEFDHEILLQQYLGEEAAHQQSAHLRGGQFKILSFGKERKPILTYSSQWDSNDEAARYFSSYEKVLHGKWKRCDASTDDKLLFAGTGDNGYFVVRLTGDTVTSVEGIDESTEWNRLKASEDLRTAGPSIR